MDSLRCHGNSRVASQTIKKIWNQELIISIFRRRSEVKLTNAKTI